MIVDLTGYTTGFCDRLKQLTFCTALAALENDSSLRIKELATDTCPFAFTDLCHVDGFDSSPWDESCGQSNLRFDGFVRPTLSDTRKYKPTEAVISDADFLELWLNSYQRLRPNEDIQSKIDALPVGSDCVGLHVRLTDKIREMPVIGATVAPNQVRRIETVAHRILQDELRKRKLQKIFLAADNEDSRDKWVRKLTDQGYTVVTHQAQFDRTKTRQTSGEDFIVDLFALSRCETIIGTTYSGVVRTAAWIGSQRRFTFAIDRMPWERLWNGILTIHQDVKRGFGS